VSAISLPERAPAGHAARDNGTHLPLVLIPLLHRQAMVGEGRRAIFQ